MPGSDPDPIPHDPGSLAIAGHESSIWASFPCGSTADHSLTEASDALMNFMKCVAATIKDTKTAKGRGVYATRPVLSGETIEICPVIVFPADWDDMPKEIQRVVYAWGHLTNGPPSNCIAMGWGSMYNHENPANVRYTADAENNCMVFTAARNIEAGEELTINYNETVGDIHSTEDVWFKNTGVKPL